MVVKDDGGEGRQWCRTALVKGGTYYGGRESPQLVIALIRLSSAYGGPSIITLRVTSQLAPMLLYLVWAKDNACRAHTDFVQLRQ
jgi:hypothetical protein